MKVRALAAENSGLLFKKLTSTKPQAVMATPHMFAATVPWGFANSSFRAVSLLLNLNL
jgi:hypothetical protein